MIQGGPQYYGGKTLAGFTPAEQRAQKGIYGYAFGPESQALQAGATANLGNVYKLGQGLAGLRAAICPASSDNSTRSSGIRTTVCTGMPWGMRRKREIAQGLKCPELGEQYGRES